MGSRRRAGPALQRAAGRRAAGQPQRRAQRDRVLRVRAEGAGLRRSASARWPTSPTCSTSSARARELDAFASAHDAQLAVTLRANGAAWSVGLPAAMRRAPRLRPRRGAGPAGAAGAPKRARRRCWCWPSTPRPRSPRTRAGGGRERDARLDVPQTEPPPSPSPPGRRPRARWPANGCDARRRRTGSRCRLHGFAAIGTELGQLYAALEAHDLAAGSAAARRLFS